MGDIQKGWLHGKVTVHRWGTAEREGARTCGLSREVNFVGSLSHFAIDYRLIVAVCTIVINCKHSK